jgi:Uma2 family endonuclease
MADPAENPRRFTYGDYCTWGDEGRWELINGVVYDMAPAPARIHQDVAGEVFVQIKNHLRDGPCRAYSAPFDVRLPDRGEADDAVETVVQPDISLICDPSKLDDKGCRGAPDWIIEVLSPRTAAKDQIQKRDIYERHGVKEYWLVHPVDRLLFVYRFAADGYGKPDIQPTEGRTPVATLPGLEIDWDAVFPPVETSPNPA